MIYADIEIFNATDISLARKNIIDTNEIKSAKIKVLVDTGVHMTSINATLQKQLDLPFIEKKTFKMNDGTLKEFDVAGPACIKFKNRTCNTNVLNLENENDSMLGKIQFAELAVLIDYKNKELTINPKHPSGAIVRM
jgi:clan AA aspartic protease